MKQWNILNKKRVKNPKEITEILFENRNISKLSRKDFFNPNIHNITGESVGLDKDELIKFSKRIDKAIKKGEKIIIFGDYDVDGICATAILWETLYVETKNVMPYIPGRIEEGYGLSIKGLDNLLKEYPDTSLVITVDNGIVAFDAIDYAKKKGIDVIVTDHHQKEKDNPDAYCIIHTTTLCGAGIAWFLAKYLGFEDEKKINEKLELACLATVADLVPLVGPNRSIVKYGIEELKSTKRIGIQELIQEAQLISDSINVYSIGFIIAPRLNATGRIDSAMEALRLLCTSNKLKAKELAGKISGINKNRQTLTEESVQHARQIAVEKNLEKITVVAHESYNQGVIGLIASQLVEVYYKPAFAISKGETISKGSARSIRGVNIIELLRSVKHTLIEVGGHPMAAGFSLKTEKIEEFVEEMSKKADEIVGDRLLVKNINIDCKLSFSLIDIELIGLLNKFAPYGMGNPEPVFMTNNVTVLESKIIGKERNHLKMKLKSDGKVIDAVAFKMAEKARFTIGDMIDIAYTVDENEWNGNTLLQLKIKDLHYQ